jgi:hypothetical protein
MSYAKHRPVACGPGAASSPLFVQENGNALGHRLEVYVPCVS